MTATFTDVADFAAAFGITMTAVQVEENPHMRDFVNANHWYCTLKRVGRLEDAAPRYRMGVYFSKGYGHNGQPPRVTEVLETLILDSSVLDLTFADWCDEYGCNPDSRKDERTYKAVRTLAERFRKFMGGSLDATTAIENI